MDKTKLLGRAGEDAAAEYLKNKGYGILMRNYRSHTGEIDIIAIRRGTIIFVEVKTRRSKEYGLPSEAVEAHKRKKMARVAEAYLGGKGWWEKPCRFDVIEVMPAGDGYRIHHIENAFML